MSVQQQTHIDAHIAGEISGQVAVGNHNIQVSVAHGGIYLDQGAKIEVQRRPGALRWSGKSPPTLAGRESEVKAALRGLEEGLPIEFYGMSGIGKTILLRHLAQNPPEMSDGVVYKDVRGQDAPDVLQFLFDAFYEVNVPFKPSEAQLRHYLQSTAAVIVLDDVGFDRDDLADVMDHLPESAFLLASERRRLWGGGRAVALRGLTPEAGLIVLQSELGRDLDAEKQAAAREICTALQGHPLSILRSAALVSEANYRLEQVAGRLSSGPAADALADELQASLTEDELAVLKVLSAVGGASLAAQHVAVLSGVPDAEAVLESLVRRHVIQAHSPRYSIAAASPQAGALDDAALAHFAGWARRPETEAADVVADMPALLEAMNQSHDPKAILDLGRAAEDALIVTGSWSAWRRLLEHMLTAARAAGDRSAEARILHQLGTRALGLEDPETARARLTEALTIRDELGDHNGAFVTRHNLEMLDGRWPPPAGPPPDKPPGGRRSKLLVGAALLVALLGVMPFLPIDLPGTSRRPPGPLDKTAAPPIAAGIQWNPQSIDFGEQPVATRSRVQVITVTNAGDTPVSIEQVSIGGVHPTDFDQADGCLGTRLEPGDSCTVSLAFVPGAEGPRDAVVEVVTDGPDAVSVAVAGTGSRVQPGRVEIAVSPAAIDFGQIDVGASSAVRQIRVDNRGDRRVAVRASIAGTHPSDFVISESCGKAALRPRAHCGIAAVFAPQERGTRSATVLVVPGNGNARAVSLTGRGRPGEIPPPLPTPPPPPPPPGIDRIAGIAIIEPYSGGRPYSDPLIGVNPDFPGGGAPISEVLPDRGAPPSGRVPSSGGLPFTGADLSLFVLAATGGITSGVAILRISGRRRRVSDRTPEKGAR